MDTGVRMSLVDAASCFFVMYSIYGVVYVEPTLHSRNEATFHIASDLFNLLLNLQGFY
jgi:hypothetical protein